MPIPIAGYRIFICCPDGLDSERDKCRQTVDDFNKRSAIKRGVLFVPIDSRDVPRGVGRAQSIINTRMLDCDYVLVMVWNKLGSSPGTDGQREFISGTVEEYSRAVECVNARNGPVRNVIVFFKQIPPKELETHSPVIDQVLEFKRKVQKEAYYGEFNDESDLEILLTQHLDEWLRLPESVGQPDRRQGTVVHREDEEQA
jgi:hypothetical protein